jgi:hypothetical protein
MFCPNCASANSTDQNYCRSCGLKLDAIAANLAEQFPSVEFAELERRTRRAQLLGVGTLSVAGLIGLAMLLGKIFYAKISLFGPDAVFWGAFIAMICFGLLSVVFFNYPQFGLKMDRVNPRLPAPPVETDTPAPGTNKLLADPPFEPASVTEHSTELLKKPR